MNFDNQVRCCTQPS